MDEIKDMLLGIAILLAVILVHLFLDDGLWTDLIGFLGMGLVVSGYNGKKKSE